MNHGEPAEATQAAVRAALANDLDTPAALRPPSTDGPTARWPGRGTTPPRPASSPARSDALLGVRL